MPTALIAAGIGAAGSYLGGKTAADAADRASQMQMQMYNRNAGNLQPWISAGQNANNIYGNALGLNGSSAQHDYFNNFQDDPYYTGIVRAGQEGVMNSALARGRGYGGNALADLDNYTIGQRKGAYDTRLNELAGVSGQGLQAAGNLAGVGTTAANNAGQFTRDAGMFTGNSYMGVANSLNRGLNMYNYNTSGNTPNGYSTNMNDYGGPPTYQDPFAGSNFANFDR